MAEKLIFRMSESGDCPKALVAERLGHEPTPAPAWLEAAAREGRRHEQWIKEDLRSEGYTIEECLECPICKERYGTERQGIHVEIDLDSFLLIGHTDGRFHKNGEHGGLEIKSMSQYEFDRWMKDGFGGFSEYAAQLTLYMVADPQESWLYIIKNRSNGYTPRKTITELPIEPTGIFSNLETVVSCVEKRVLPEVEFNPNSIQCRRCRYSKLCVPAVKELSLVEESNLLGATVDWRKGKELKAEGERLIGQAIGTFEKHTQATGVEKWRFGELTFTTIHVRESVSYDKKRLLEIFSEEQLKPAMQVRLPYSYTKVADLTKEETGNAEMSE